MNVLQYNNILKSIRECELLPIYCIRNLQKDFPNINNDTLYSILSLEYQKRMKRNHNKSNSLKYWNEYLNAIKNKEPPGVLMRIAQTFNITPCLVAKLVLKHYFEENDINFMSINSYLQDTSLIQDMDLSYEVFLCTMFDNLYSPLSDAIKQSVGQQYEIKLTNEVRKLGVAFRNEEHLRRNGYDKTPDIKLEVPVVVDGKVVNWIESKALFADQDNHSEYMKNQYLSYWNRFGPGMVIYWFGYLETILDPNDERFVIKDCFPKNILLFSDLN